MLNETLLMSPIVWWIDWTGCIANHKGFWRFACKFHQEANSSKLSKHWLAQLSESSRESWEAFKGRGCLWSKRFFLVLFYQKKFAYVLHKPRYETAFSSKMFFAQSPPKLSTFWKIVANDKRFMGRSEVTRLVQVKWSKLFTQPSSLRLQFVLFRIDRVHWRMKRHWHPNLRLQTLPKCRG